MVLDYLSNYANGIAVSHVVRNLHKLWHVKLQERLFPIG